MRLNPAEHRPNYWWAGPSTIRMNLLKRDFSIDHQLYLEGYQEKGLDMIKQIGHSIAYLMYNWGWEPETEKEDWQVFKDAVKLCHERGIEVFAYISSNNIVYGDWFPKHPEALDWMCRDKNGLLLSYPHTHRRAICCYNNQGWIAIVKKMVSQALSLGPDGIFLDNIFQWECHCPLCQKKFKDYLKKESLEVIELNEVKHDVKDPYYRAYCRFRCQATDNCFATVRNLIQQTNPAVVLTSNTYSIVDENRVVLGGFEAADLIKHQDLWLIENFTFPHIDEGVVINNCMTYKVAFSLGNGKLVSSVPYIHGAKKKISGVDLASVMYEPREFKLQIAEASSQNAAAVIKGSEYYDDYWTLVTDPRFKEQQQAIGDYHLFLEEHKHLYQNTEDISNIGLLYSQNSMAWTREISLPSFCGFFQTFYQNHFPFNIITEENLEKGQMKNNEMLIAPSVCCFSETGLKTLADFLDSGGKLIVSANFATHNLKGDPTSHKLADKIQNHTNTTYYDKCPATTVEKNRLFNFNVTNFLLPRESDKIVKKIKELIKLPIEVKAGYSEGITVWKKDDEYIVHLVNYDAEGTDAEILFPSKIKQCHAYSPDGNTNGRVKTDENALKIKDTDVYDLVRVKL